MRFLLFFVSILCIQEHAFAQNCYSADSLAQHLLTAIQSKDFKELQKLQPTVGVIKQNFGKELGALSNENIQKMISENPKTTQDWEKIQKDAVAAKIDLNKLTVSSFKIERVYGDDNPLVGLNISLKEGNKTYQLAIACIESEECFYFNEFLKSIGVWVSK